MTPTKEELQNKLQLIFCKQRKHWAVVTTINCDGNEGSIQIVENLFTCDNVKPRIKMIKCSKQKGSKDCGLYAIAIDIFKFQLASIKTSIQTRCNEINASIQNPCCHYHACQN